MTDLPPGKGGPQVVPVRNMDFWILAAFGVLGLVALAAFFLFLHRATPFLDYPPLASTPSSVEAYTLDALVYRERRMAFALTTRTFITGLSFIVGLALCTQGGLFILRQVTVLTTISGGWGPRAAAQGLTDPAVPDAVKDKLATAVRDAQFAFGSYSPGIVFLLGGVFIMALTQWLAIPIRGVEVVPVGTVPLCAAEEGSDFDLCRPVSSMRAPEQEAPGEVAP